MKPAYEIFADGERVTPRFVGRLTSLEISDDAGEQADELTLQIEDSSNLVALPKPSAELEVMLGFGEDLQRMGLYIVDDVEIAGPPIRIKIKGAGAPFIRSKKFAPLQERKTRSFKKKTIGEIAKTIAGEHGLKAAVDAEIGTVAISHVDQTEESDSNLLTRLAHDAGAIFKPTFGKLVIAKKGESKSVSGKHLPEVELSIAEISSWNLKLGERSKFQKVVCLWHDTQTGEQVKEEAGSGEPVYIEKRVFANQETAARAAQAMHRRFQYQNQTLSLTMPGRLDIAAETPLRVEGGRAEFAGEWVADKVKHSLSSGGLKTRVKAVRN